MFAHLRGDRKLLCPQLIAYITISKWMYSVQRQRNSIPLVPLLFEKKMPDTLPVMILILRSDHLEKLSTYCPCNDVWRSRYRNLSDRTFYLMLKFYRSQGSSLQHPIHDERRWAALTFQCLLLKLFTIRI